MSADEIKTWLEEGIAAIDMGRRAEARELLMRVVTADEKNMQAWLWLSGVVTTLEDREVCLENALSLDPDNESIQRDLEAVRAQIAATPEIEPESALPHVAGDTSLPAGVKVDFSEDEFSDPLTCVYCGYLTSETDRRCPKCKHPLQGSFYTRERPRWIGVAFTISAASALFTAGSLFLLSIIFASALSTGRPAAQAVSFAQVLLFYLGQPVQLAPQAQTLMLSIFPRETFYLRLTFSLLTLIVAFGLLTRRRVFYILYIADLAFAAVSLLLNSQIHATLTVTPASASILERLFGVVINETFGVFINATGLIAGVLLLLQIVMAFLIEGDFDKKTERLWCAIDPSVHEATGAFVRAKSFMKREMWVMAVRYLQRAISLQPIVVEYYLALAESYARLGRYVQSLHILDQASLVQPDSTLVENLRGVILELQARTVTPPPPEPTGEV